MFEIVNKEQKKVTISLHLEEINSALGLQQQIISSMEVFSLEKITASCMDNILAMNIEKWKDENYEVIIDFFHIKCIEPNLANTFKNWINSIENKKICNYEFEEKKDYNDLEVTKEDYTQAFNLYGKKYIGQYCCDPEGYTTQTGVELSIYVNLKKIIEDTNEILRWCYVIACKLYKNAFFKKRNKDKKILLFCHTLNGSNIAGVLSQLLDCNLVYVDHLGPYNKLNKVNFYREMYEPTEYIIISDMVCQGNELLRAKNIVEYLGGTVKGCAGLLKLEISNISFQGGVDAFAIQYSAESAREELHYTIRTKLCPIECNTGKE